MNRPLKKLLIESIAKDMFIVSFSYSLEGLPCALVNKKDGSPSKFVYKNDRWVEQI